ncbi:MAG TPA: hypothetical protein VLG09_02835 [Candidatus Saccharimonadales bacterium]|nr:hypothetical protein [Candidatus Saccharimonadales bacterium]
MILATTLAAAHETAGAVAVMAVMAAVFGVVAWAITGIVIFTGVDNGNLFSRMMVGLRILLIPGAACFGAYLGYQFMH